jgi:pteridine reductase
MDIVLHYRRSATSAEALRARLEGERPGSVLMLQADLHRVERFPRLIAEIDRWRGRLDLLVNNASTFYPTPMDRVTEEQWKDLMGSNLKAPFFLARHAADLLRASRGAIVNMVDIHADRPLLRHPIYCMAKAGNAMMVKALARELGPEVRVNGVAPGAILWPEAEISDEGKQEILARTALKRPGAPDDIARAVLFLFRDARYVTGQVLTVDGGRTLQQ